jgi:type I restriction enzyme, S subunit
LIFSNVFAWEGGIAVAKPIDKGRVGSHRFITCVPNVGVATAKYLCFYFLTQEGLEKIGIASPGGAGRNRTLGLQALANIEVPVPDYEKQLWFDDFLDKVNALRELQSASEEELSALMPSILDKAFKGEL